MWLYIDQWFSTVDSCIYNIEWKWFYTYIPIPISMLNSKRLLCVWSITLKEWGVTSEKIWKNTITVHSISVCVIHLSVITADCHCYIDFTTCIETYTSCIYLVIIIQTTTNRLKVSEKSRIKLIKVSFLKRNIESYYIICFGGRCTNVTNKEQTNSNILRNVISAAYCKMC